MGVLKKAKITFTCEFRMKDYLSEWAETENRTVSNLVETLVQEAIAAREQSEPLTSSSDKDKGKKGGNE